MTIACLIPLVFAARRSRAPIKHSRVRKDYHRLLSEEDKRRRQRHFPRYSLQDTENSSWRGVYDGRCDQSMITLTGFDCASFEWLAERFDTYFKDYSPFVDAGLSCFDYRRKSSAGRRRKINGRDCLGLILTLTTVIHGR